MLINYKKIFWSIILATPVLSYGFSWQDLWQNKNQQAKALLQNNQAHQAAEIFHDSQWKGVAYYKDKQYDKAYSEFQHDASADGLYNQGNALAYMGRYTDAIHAYEESLKLDENNSDARHNIEVLKKLQQDKDKQNQQDKQSPDGKKSADQSNQQKNQSAGNSSQNNANRSNQQNKQNDDISNHGQNSDENNSTNKPNQHQNKNSQSGKTGVNNSEHKNDPVNNQSNQMSQANKSDDKMMNKTPEQSAAQQQAGKSQNKNDVANSQYANPQNIRQEQQMTAILSQIPDDPGGLLRNKFIRDYQNQQQGSGQ